MSKPKKSSKQVNGNPKSKRPSFDRYSPKEYNALKTLPRSEILKDILKREGVELRRTNEIRSVQQDERKVRVVPRTSTSGGASSEWFYLKVEGFKPFSTGVQVEKSLSGANSWKDDPDSWWKESQHAELLSIEIESAEYFTGIGRLKGLAHLVLQLVFITKIQEANGLDGLVFLKQLLEGGNLANLHSYIKDREAFAKALVPVLMKMIEEPKTEKQKQIERDIEELKRKCVEWEPGKPLDWRIRPVSPSKDEYSKLFNRFSEPGDIWSYIISIFLVLMLDGLNLMERFKVRYPKPAKIIEEKLS